MRLAAFWLLDFVAVVVSPVPHPRFERGLSDPESYFQALGIGRIGRSGCEIAKKQRFSLAAVFGVVVSGSGCCAGWLLGWLLGLFSDGAGNFLESFLGGVRGGFVGV